MSTPNPLADKSAYDLCQRASDAPAPIPEYNLTHLVTAMHSAVRELCRVDAQLTEQGCIYGYLQPKWDKGGPTNRLVMRFPAEKGKRPRVYIGADPERQRNARLGIARYEVRHTLRTRLAGLYKRQLELIEAAIELNRNAGTLHSELAALVTEIRSSVSALESEAQGTP